MKVTLLQDVNYPLNGMNEIYEKGINIMIDSFAHTDEKDISFVRDSKREDKPNSEHKDTPVDGLDEPKLLIHNKNEIPLFLGPNKKYLTLVRYDGHSVGEVQIPLKVVTFDKYQTFNYIHIMN